VIDRSADGSSVGLRPISRRNWDYPSISHGWLCALRLPTVGARGNRSPITFASLVTHSWRAKADAGDADATEQVRRYAHRAAKRLHDLTRDPNEWRSLAGDPVHQDAKAELKRRLEAWMRTQVATRDGRRNGRHWSTRAATARRRRPRAQIDEYAERVAWAQRAATIGASSLKSLFVPTFWKSEQCRKTETAS